MKQQIVIEDGDVGKRPVGFIEIEVPEEIVIFDFAITPIVTIAPNEEARVHAFLASRRTTLEIRPREESYPFSHVGIRPPDFNAEDWGGIRDIVKEAADRRRSSRQDSPWLDGMVEKIGVALAEGTR